MSKRPSMPIRQPIINRTGNHCWLSSILQLFANNLATLIPIIDTLNPFLQDPNNFHLSTNRDYYEKLRFFNHFFYTNINNLLTATTTYKITKIDLEQLHNAIFDTTTVSDQDIYDVIITWFSWMDIVSTIVKSSVRNELDVVNRQFLFQNNEINYDPTRVVINRKPATTNLLSVSINKSNSCNSLQELINQQSDLLSIDDKTSPYSFNSQEILMLPNTNFVFIRINREFVKHIGGKYIGREYINTPLFIERTIDFTNLDKSRATFILQGIICHPHGHYYYVSCNIDGSPFYLYDDDNRRPVSASDIYNIRNEGSFLFYVRNNSLSLLPIAPRLKDIDIGKIKKRDAEILDFYRSGRHAVIDPTKIPIYTPLKLYGPVITGAHAISKSVMLFTYSSMDSITDYTFSPSLFYFYLGSSIKVNYFDYLFYLDVQSNFCETLVNNVPNPDYYDLFNMGESLKDKYNKSIEYTTENFEKVYKQNEEKTINKEVNLDYTLYNYREILTGQSKQNKDTPYSLFYYNHKLDE
jgi:hypothetical protein